MRISIYRRVVLYDTNVNPQGIGLIKVSFIESFLSEIDFVKVYNNRTSN